MARRSIATALVLAGFVSGAMAQDKSLDEKGLIEAVSPSLLVAEIGVKPDNGEEPYGAGWGSRCPSCGQVHSNSVAEYVKQERPLVVPAFLVADDLAVIPDPLLNDRFLTGIKLRQGKQTVDATMVKFFTNQRAVLVKLSQPLAGAKPLVFEKGPTKDLKTIVYAEGNGQWNIGVSGLSLSITQTPTGPKINSVSRDSVVVAPNGRARALVFSESLPTDDSWQGSPLDWPGRTVQEQAALAAMLGQQIKSGIVRVHLSFRSPPANPADNMGMRSRFGSRNDDDDNATERDVQGVVVAPNRVLVLATLKPNVTARLERVSVYAGDNAAATPAKFLCTIKAYGALVVETALPLPQVMTPATDSPERFVGPALTMAEVRIAGEDRIDYLSRVRVSGLRTGWRQNLYPEVTLTGDQTKNTFIFNDAGQLVALPLVIRPKPKGEENRYGSDDNPTLTLASQLTGTLADPIAAADTANVPLSEAEENRLAWLGVELQQLTPELARLNKVSQLTQDGETGALVTFVYPDSPAAKAGISVGTVLLRLIAPDQPEPISIKADEYMFAEREFPWMQYDQFPEAYFDRMPTPWPTAATTLSKALTEIGFGKQVTIELFQNGHVEKKPIEIAQSPANYDSAAKAKHAASGLTLRPMTYEVRRYFQLTPDKPGLVISRIEAGSRASKAGLKPYEFVTAVNGQPVRTPEEFLAAAKNQAELRLDITRMNKSRVVKLKNDVESATQPAGDASATPTTLPTAPAAMAPTTAPHE